jgi:hypothetical protein
VARDVGAGQPDPAPAHRTSVQPRIDSEPDTSGHGIRPKPDANGEDRWTPLAIAGLVALAGIIVVTITDLLQDGRIEPSTFALFAGAMSPLVLMAFLGKRNA